MLYFLRPWLFWLAAPVVLIVGTFAGVRSVSPDQRSALPTPNPSAEASAAARVPPFVLMGQIVRVDLPSRTMVVQRKDGKTVTVFARVLTIVKLGQTRIRPRDLQVGDMVTVVGRPFAQGMNALLITIRPRAVRPAPSATPAK